MINFVEIPTPKEEILTEFSTILDSGKFVQGQYVETFESNIAEYLEVENAICVASGYAALELALRALNIGYGDEVIVPANSFVGTASVVIAVGATPIFVDVDTNTHNIDWTKIKVTSHTKAIIPVHLYGNPAIIPDIGVPIIEDACQSIGASVHGRQTGTMGVAGCFSFYPTKNLGCCGEGGLVVTNDISIACKIRSMRNYGRSGNAHLMFPVNAKMDELQAAALNIKLKYLDEYNNHKRHIASIYNEQLHGFGQPIIPEGCGPNYHLYVIQVDNRKQFIEQMLSDGILTAVYYNTPMYMQPCFKHLDYNYGDFPVADRLCERVISLPIHHNISTQDAFYIAEKVMGGLCD